LYFLRILSHRKRQTLKLKSKLLRDDLQKKLKELAIWAGVSESAFWIETGKESQAFSICGNKKDLTQLKQQLTKAVLQTQKDDKLIKVSWKSCGPNNLTA
jgi:hypothetical protein